MTINKSTSCRCARYATHTSRLSRCHPYSPCATLRRSSPPARFTMAQPALGNLLAAHRALPARCRRGRHRRVRRPVRVERVHCPMLHVHTGSSTGFTSTQASTVEIRFQNVDGNWIRSKPRSKLFDLKKIVRRCVQLKWV